MKQLTIIILVIAMPLGEALAADDWIGLDDEQSVLVGFDLARQDSDEQSQSFSLILPIGSSAGYQGHYSKTQLTDGPLEFDNLALISAIWFQLTELVEIEIQHFFEGNTGELEKETLGIAINLNQGNWQLGLQLDEGDLLIFKSERFLDFTDNRSSDRFSSEVSGKGMVLSWQTDPWYWQANYQRYDYEDDLSPLDRIDFAQFIVKSSALAQSSLLISQSSSFLVGHSNYENDYSVLFSRDRSAIDQSYSDSLVVSWQHWTSPRMGYLFAASMPAEFDSIGLTLGLRWVL